MKFSDQVRRGMLMASVQTGRHPRQAALLAGFNQNQARRFLTGQNDMKLDTLERICVDGFKMSVQKIWELGK